MCLRLSKDEVNEAADCGMHAVHNIIIILLCTLYTMDHAVRAYNPCMYYIYQFPFHSVL